jgi:NAD-dependent histone deacetylase SIR2
MVLYNEHNPDDEAIGSVVKSDLKTRPDALIVVGTTLKVPGVKRIVREMCGVVRDRRDGVTIWVNNDPPPPGRGFEWDLIVKGPCDHVASVASMPKWDEKVKVQAVTGEEEEKIKADPHHFDVVITTSSKPKTYETIQDVVTPVASPRFSPITVEKKPQLLPPALTALLTPGKAPRPQAQATKIRVTKPVKTTKSETTAPKKAGPKAKKAAVGNAKISAAFKVSKASAQVATAAKDKPPMFPGLVQFQVTYQGTKPEFNSRFGHS